MNYNRKTIDRLVAHFGVERICAALPQHEVRCVLELVSVQELADQLGVGYDSLRSQMQSGEIPFPDFRLVRRAYYKTDEADAIKQKLKNSNKN